MPVAARVIAALLAPLLMLAVPGPHAGSHRHEHERHRTAAGHHHPHKHRPERIQARTIRTVDLASYTDLASWVDIYNRRPWDHPVKTIGRLHGRGVRTLFLQTSNYGAGHDIFRPESVGRFIDAAHRRNIDVVAWYVPSFAKLRVDYARTMAAVRFRSDKGETFDSFAMDIEATVVGSIATRNNRLELLSRRVRKAVGDDYTLGAIIPDPGGSTYWLGFPYKTVAEFYDVFLPMSYFTYRTSGPHRVFDYTKKNVAIIRNETNDPQIPIHVIGGIADSAKPNEVRSFARAVRTKRALGASLYDYPITGHKKWNAMRKGSTARP